MTFWQAQERFPWRNYLEMVGFSRSAQQENSCGAYCAGRHQYNRNDTGTIPQAAPVGSFISLEITFKFL